MRELLGRGLMRTFVRGLLIIVLVAASAWAASGAIILKIKVPSANLWLKPDLNSTVLGTLRWGLILESGQKTGAFYEVRLTEEGKAVISGYLDEGAVQVLCPAEGPAAVPLAEALILRVKIPSANVWAEADPNSRVIGRLEAGKLLEVRQRGYTFLEVIHVTAAGQAMEGYVHRAAVEGVCRGEEVAEPLTSAVLMVKVQRANVWSEPDINSPILGELRLGDRLEVIRKVRAYYEVRFRAISGTYTGYVQESALAETPPEPPPTPRRPAEAVSPLRLFPLFEVGGFYSVLNTYRRGGLDEWWRTLTGQAADQGSAAFFALEGAAYLRLGTDRWYLGASLAYHFPVAHAIWGSQASAAGVQEVAVKPGLLSLSLPLRYFPWASRSLSVTLIPSLLLGWANGSVFFSDAGGALQDDFSPRAKIGMGIAAGMEYAFLKNLAVTLRAGLRTLSVALVWKSTQEKVATLDLGGGTVVLGFLFRL